MQCGGGLSDLPYLRQSTTVGLEAWCSEEQCNAQQQWKEQEQCKELRSNARRRNSEGSSARNRSRGKMIGCNLHHLLLVMEPPSDSLPQQLLQVPDLAP